MNWLRRRIVEIANRYADAPIRIPAGTTATVTIAVYPPGAQVFVGRNAFHVEHGANLVLVLQDTQARP